MFPGSSEMARRMRAFHWAGTALGPPEAWPSSLQVAVSLCLRSCLPTKIWWGPSLIMLYNDAYIPSLGPHKHPAALGRSAWEVWPEIWDLLGPLIERSMTTGEATWSPDVPLFVARRLPKEEAFVDVAITPIPGLEDGEEVGGVFCACVETTEKKVGQRRLETLRELRLRTAQARPMDEVCRLCAEVLGENPRDLPFAAIYALEEGGSLARLKACAGLRPGGWCPPAIVDARQGGPGPWPPLGAALRSGRAVEVEDLQVEEAALPLDPWSDPVRRARVLPMRGADPPAGLLVAGISPRRPLDDGYGEFLEQVADHLGGALAAALAFEVECRRVEALAELDRAKMTFFTNISHEFRTPLTLMLGPLEEAMRGNPECGPHLQTAYRNGLRLLKLVDALMNISRFEAGRKQGLFQATDLSACTAHLASMFRSAVDKAGLRLEVHCPPLPAAVYLDAGMWEKVVFNLISNALKHTFQGEIEVSLAPAGPGWVHLRVRDTGVGIALAELPLLFGRFHRVRGAQARTHEGSGIGLALVKELVKLHGGEIQVESVEGQGTCFTVRLPTGMDHLPPDQIVAGPAAPLTAGEADLFVAEALRWLPEPPAGEAPAPLAGPARPRLLIADDNADMREYLRRLLTEAYEVVAFADGEAALASALERRPDLVLTDVMMPRMDGFELLRRLRSEPRTRTLPIILISARAGEEAQVDGVGLGADDYLVKPFTARELLARVASHLALARVRGELEAELLRAREAVEEQVARRTLELRESEARLQGFIRHSTAAIAIQGADGRYLLINPRMEAALGRPAREILGRTSEELLPLARWAPTRERERRVLDLGLDVQTEEEWIHGDGSSHDHLVTAFPLVDCTGQHWGLGLLAYDVTERKREARALLQSQKLEALGLLAGGIAHDFNNLLGAMQGNVELAMAEDGLEAARPYLATVKGLMAKGSGLLRQMLAYAGRGKASICPLDLNLVVKELAQLLEASIAKKARLQLNLHPHLPLMEGDPAQIQQVVMNLVLNASEAMGDAKGVITVSTFLEDLDQGTIDAVHGGQAVRPGPHAGLEVADTGAGMAPEVLKQIFDPFFTTKLTGRGLGLAAIQGILRGHQGAIQVTSTPGQGSAFRLWFPAGPGRVVPVAPEVPLPRPPEGKGQAGATLLVVDDEDEMRSVVVAALERAGFRTLQARDGLEALDLFEAHRDRIRMILMDLTMPNLDGEEVCHELRRRGAAVPVILSSGFSQAEAMRRLDGLGLAGFLQKPFELGAMVNKVQNLLLA